MSALLLGPLSKTLGRDAEGHREYKICWLVMTAPTDGPYTALNCPGLPVPGAVWDFGDDYDPWAWCRADATVSVHQEKEGENTIYWKVEQKFSSKPPDRDKQRCQDNQIEDPLQEPPKVSGGFTKKTAEATRDRFDQRILTSSHEMIRGPQVEFDDSTPTVRIEMNVAELNLGLVCSMIDTLNQFPLWGLDPRKIKLSNGSWVKNYYGTCFVYYTWTFDFDVNFKGFDRDVLDEGTKVLHGEWNASTGKWTLLPVWIDGGTFEEVMPDPLNPNHFDRFKDRNGENCRVILDGSGMPFDPEVANVTMDCATSPSGAPVTWQVKGFEGPPETTTHESACVWTGTKIGLEYVAPDWILTNLDIPGVIWSLPLDEWHHMGPNILPRTTGVDGPASVMVEAFEEEPGKIHIEKYNESDFLVLGIPATF